MTGPAMDPRLAEWLASRDTGVSSKAIMFWLSAGVKENEWGAGTPSDPADLARCLRLLERIPEWKPRIGEMAAAGGLWPTFAKRWAEMECAFIAECGGKLPAKGDNWSCPKTYELMQQVGAQAREADKPDFNEVKLGGMTVRFGK